jgi:hypothetical protein
MTWSLGAALKAALNAKENFQRAPNPVRSARRIYRCFDIDEPTNVSRPRNSTEQQCASGYGKHVDVRRLAAVSEGGYWWNSTTQELIEILPEHHADYRQNQALINQAIKRWNGETS